MQGANLIGAQLDNITKLSGAVTQCAALSVVDLEKTTITPEQLNAMFGDASVTLPDGKGPNDPEWPDHWSKEELGWSEFDKQWRAFQRERGFDADNPV